MESSMFGYTGFTLCLVLSHLLDQMGSSLLTTFFFSPDDLNLLCSLVQPVSYVWTFFFEIAGAR